MHGQGYESVSKSDDPSSKEADSGTATLALVVSVLGCIVSLLAIGFVVHSIR